jgi:hypothetical protein
MRVFEVSALFSHSEFILIAELKYYDKSPTDRIGHLDLAALANLSF